MRHIKPLLLLTALSVLNPVVVTAAPVLSGDYLEGRWTQGPQEGCTSDQALYVKFHANHTLEAGHGKAVSAIGFWESTDDSVTVHLLVAPDTSGGHPFHQQRYYYQYMSPRILAVQADSFDYSEETGTGAGERKTLTRCK